MPETEGHAEIQKPPYNTLTSDEIRALFATKNISEVIGPQSFGELRAINYWQNQNPGGEIVELVIPKKGKSNRKTFVGRKTDPTGETSFYYFKSLGASEQFAIDYLDKLSTALNIKPSDLIRIHPEIQAKKKKRKIQKADLLNNKEASPLIEPEEITLDGAKEILTDPDRVTKIGNDAIGDLRGIIKWMEQSDQQDQIVQLQINIQGQNRITFVGREKAEGKDQIYYCHIPKGASKESRTSYRQAIITSLGISNDSLISYTPSNVKENQASMTPTHNDALPKEEVIEPQTDWQTIIDLIIDLEKDDSLRERKRSILQNLPPDFTEKLTAHLKSTYINQLRFPQSAGKEINDTAFIKGEIFEHLLETEDTLYHLDPEWKKHPQTEIQKQLSQQLIAFMGDPLRFDVYDRAIRNPDFIKIIFENGVFTIGSSIEAKTHLDNRSLDQLTKFLQNFKNTVSLINNLEDADKHGLNGLGKHGYQLQVSERYYQMLAIPQDVATLDTDEAPTSFIDIGMTRTKRADLIKLINDNDLIKIVRSSFTREEITILARYFTAAVLKRINEETRATNPS